MTICRYHIKEMIIFLRKIQRCSVSTPASTLNNTGVMLNSVNTSDNTGYSNDNTHFLWVKPPTLFTISKYKSWNTIHSAL